MPGRRCRRLRRPPGETRTDASAARRRTGSRRRGGWCTPSHRDGSRAGSPDRTGPGAVRSRSGWDAATRLSAAGGVMVDLRYVHHGGRYADSAGISCLQMFGRRVRSKQYGLHLRRGVRTASHTEGDDPIPVPELVADVDFPPRLSHRHLIPGDTLLDRGNRERAHDRQHVTDPKIPLPHHSARVDGASRQSTGATSQGSARADCRTHGPTTSLRGQVSCSATPGVTEHAMWPGWTTPMLGIEGGLPRTDRCSSLVEALRRPLHH